MLESLVKSGRSRCNAVAAMIRSGISAIIERGISEMASEMLRVNSISRNAFIINGILKSSYYIGWNLILFNEIYQFNDRDACYDN